MSRAYLLLVQVLTLYGCGSLSSNLTESRSAKVTVVMTVDWEGRDLSDENIAAMAELRRDYPELPILHYLNAAYFTKPVQDAAEIRQKISSTLLPSDQLGLHIHGWKSLFEKSGVRFRNGPTLRHGGKPYTENECLDDCGHAVALLAYTEDELVKVINYSKEILNENGFGKAQHFRAGAWMVDDNVYNALIKTGFKTDSSAVPPQFLAKKWQGAPLFDLVKGLWASVTPTSNPYRVVREFGELLEVPNNGCLADYMTGEDMLTVVNENYLKALSDGERKTVVLGFHQETAQSYLPQVRDFLKLMRERYKNADVEFRTL